MEEDLDVPTTPAETEQLLRIVVGQCGCGCTVLDCAVAGADANCRATHMLRDRRFVVGILFGRTLREQLVREEWRQVRAQRTPAGALTGMPNKFGRWTGER